MSAGHLLQASLPPQEALAFTPAQGPAGGLVQTLEPSTAPAGSMSA